MRWYHSLLALAVLTAAVSPAGAINLFGKRSRPNPADRLQELLATVQSAKEDHKRASAAAELRQYDAATYPQVASVLVEVLKSDHSPVVRAEAAQSLGRMRPTSATAHHALETAASQDSAMRVRWQARRSLMFYHVSAPPAAAKGPEPKGPAGAPVVRDAPPTTQPLPAAPLLQPVPYQGPTTSAAAPPRSQEPPPVSTGDIARPLPRGPSPLQAIPTPVPQSREPPVAAPAPPQGSQPHITIPPLPDEGPTLAPPP
jgi:hypothetical protein